MAVTTAHRALGIIRVQEGRDLDLPGAAAGVTLESPTLLWWGEKEKRAITEGFLEEARWSWALNPGIGQKHTNALC